MLLRSLGSRFEWREDITSAMYARSATLPPALPLPTEPLGSGAVVVQVDQSRRIPAPQGQRNF